MKKLLLFFVSTVLYAVTINSPATVSGDGAVHAIASSGFARAIIITAWPTNATTNCGSSAVSACPWVGDSNVSTSRGQFLLPGGSLTLPAIGSASAGAPERYPLAGVFYIVQSGDKISITLVQ